MQQEDVIDHFQKGLDSYLTKEQIKKVCPVAFVKTPTNPGVSKRYLFINSEIIIDDLKKLGWYPVTATMRKSRGKATIFSPHMLSFQNPDLKIKGKNGDDAYPRIIVQNSSDAFSSFKFSMGIYRLVCSNGLVIADEKFSEFKIRHQGYSFEELRNVVRQTVIDLPKKVEVINRMKEKELTQKERETLAINAMKIRAGAALDDTQTSKFNYDDETLKDLLEPKRKNDEGTDLWTTFNILQEKIVKGEFHAALKGAKVRKIRAIKSFEKDLKVNKELFKMATSLVE